MNVLFKFWFLTSHRAPICMRSEGIDCTRIRDLIAVRRVILRDFVHVFPSFTDDFLLFPSDDAGRFALTVATAVFYRFRERWPRTCSGRKRRLWGKKRKSKKIKIKINERMSIWRQRGPQCPAAGVDRNARLV